MQRNSATIKDIARAVGMDYSTVSLALRDHPRIAHATRQRIQQAAEQVGYVPNRAAQALRLGRSHTIAFVLWGDNSEQIRQSFPDYTLAATAAAFAAGYELLLLQATAARLAATSIERFPELRQTDGALFVGETLDRPGLAALWRSGFPVVHLGERTLEGIALPCVGADYAQGGALAAEHLLGFGHQRLGVLYGPHADVPEIHERRMAGFTERAGDAVRAAIAVQRETAIEPVLARFQADGITAVFATEQVIGLRLLTACSVAGVGVPQDMSVVAFDDLPSAALSTPPLTCIRQPRDLAGKLGLELLRDQIEARGVTTERLFLPCMLVARASFAPPANPRAAAAEER
ncbi:MAG: LacI family DNA-binding transcriptional regulator [Chloroflexota bacterium]